MPEPLGLVDRHRVGRRGGLEADAEEHHLPVGVLPGQLQRVERRVDDAHVAALALDPEQVLARCRAPAACRRRSRRSRPGRAAISSALSMISSGVTHTGQPGPVDQLDLVGQQLVDAVPDDRVGLPAADLHHRPAAGWRWRGSRRAACAASSGSLELVEVLHRRCLLSVELSLGRPGSPACSAARPQLVAELLLEHRRAARSRRASPVADSSSRRWIAKPTWTIDVLADLRRRAGTPGRPPCGPRRSRPAPSGCRRGRSISRTLPGTARHMALSSPRQYVGAGCAGRRTRPGRAPGRRRSAARAGGAAR